MSGYKPTYTGPQEPPNMNRHFPGTGQPRDPRNYNPQAMTHPYVRPHNNTGPILGSQIPQHMYEPNYPVDMPPYRAQHPDPFPPHMHTAHRPQLPRQGSYSHPFNHNSTVDPLLPPELPPKNLSGLQSSPEPQKFLPPPLPARPTPHLPPEISAGSREYSSSSEKKIHSGRVNGVDPGFSDPLEELKRDPIAAGERFKRAAEALSSWSKRYETSMHMKTKRLQESVTHAQHDLGILKDELHKARSALSASQTGSNVLMGKLQILEQQNLSPKNDLSRGTSGDTDFSNEETQLLIADLRSQIVKLKSEVPDPNFIESLRLITQLLQEDKKMLEKKYTEVSEELHNRDNEISRLIKENQTNGSLIPEGQTGLEKHFNSQLEEHRRQNQSLQQQLQISQQKLEVSEKRETAENEPGPSKVELQNMIQHAYEFRAQLQEKMDEKEKELRQLKIQLESSREVMSGSSTRDINSSQRNWVGPDEEGKLKEQVLGLELDKQHLENALSERERTVEGFERELRMEKGKVHGLEGRIRQLETPVMDSNQDKGKEALIETLLAERNSLMGQNDALQKERGELASLKDGVPMMRNWLESRDAHIKQLSITIEEKSQECAHFKRQYEQFNLRSTQLLDFGNQVNEEKVQLELVLHKYKQRIEELEGKLSSIHSLSPSMTTAVEVYDVQVMQLSKELQASDQEKRNAVEKFSELESKNEKLVQQLHDMSIECANLKNLSSAGGGRYNFGYPGYHPEARYPIPYPPRPSPAHGGHGGHGPMQGRDSGVPYS